MVNKEYFNFLGLLIKSIKQDLRLSYIIDFHKETPVIIGKMKSIHEDEEEYEGYEDENEEEETEEEDENEDEDEEEKEERKEREREERERIKEEEKEEEREEEERIREEEEDEEEEREREREEEEKKENEAKENEEEIERSKEITISILDKKLLTLLEEKKENEVNIFKKLNNLLLQDKEALNYLQRTGILSELRRYEQKEKKENINTRGLSFVDFVNSKQTFLINEYRRAQIQDEFLRIDKIVNIQNLQGLQFYGYENITIDLMDAMDKLIKDIKKKLKKLIKDGKFETVEKFDVVLTSLIEGFIIFFEKNITIYENKNPLQDLKKEVKIYSEIYKKSYDEAVKFNSLILSNEIFYS